MMALSKSFENIQKAPMWPAKEAHVQQLPALCQADVSPAKVPSMVEEDKEEVRRDEGPAALKGNRPYIYIYLSMTISSRQCSRDGHFYSETPTTLTSFKPCESPTSGPRGGGCWELIIYYTHMYVYTNS